MKNWTSQLNFRSKGNKGSTKVKTHTKNPATAQTNAFSNQMQRPSRAPIYLFRSTPQGYVCVRGNREKEKGKDPMGRDSPKAGESNRLRRPKR